MASPTQLAYAAGIVDGEGCIRFTRLNGVPVPRLHVTNTNQRLTTLLLEWFGGYVWTDSKAYIPNAKPRYVWEVSAIRAAATLTLLLPYLFLKREQAELAIALQATKVRRGRTPVAPEVVAAREVMAARVRVLNKKGVA